MLHAMIYRVAVNAPVWQLLDYQSEHRLQPGQAVRVELGQRHANGVIIKAVQRSEFKKLKNIEQVYDIPPMPADMVWLLQWCWAYYHHAPGEVAATALPPALDAAAPEPEQWYGLKAEFSSPEDALEELLETTKRAPKQQELLRVLASVPHSESQLNECLSNWRQPLKRLVEKGWIENVPPPPAPPSRVCPNNPQLRQEQAVAVSSITSRSHQFRTWLLEGVTGSGKTEVYLQAARRILANGRQVLLLVPEIGLTPQTLQRVRQRLGCEVGEYHSGMGDSARRETWRRVATGELQVVVGTRSAVFLPFSQLGMIALDEEHDGSYKQQDGFHYSARDVAIMRAHRLNIPVVLGSATPALESLANVQRKRYSRLELKERHGSDTQWELVDVRGLGGAVFSPVAIQAMKDRLKAGEQVMVFLNRRGYAPVHMCGDCGWAANCLRCDSHLTLHMAKQRLICHHCGTEHKQPLVCPSCQHESLIQVGHGTERLEEVLVEMFPDTPVHRVDRDRMRSRQAMSELREKVLSGDPCILVGTQMLAKGHDFPKLALVLVVDADQALYSSDFRAPERLGQLLVQVAGRAGRGEHPGKVLIQTRQPEHPILTTLMSGGYPALSQSILEERRSAKLPPYTVQAMLRADALKSDPPRQFLEQVVSLLRERAKAKDMEVDILGPFPAVMERRAGRWRWQLCLQTLQRADMKAFLSNVLPDLRELPQSKNARWRVDVDPYEL
jgi:primosomal protein N' (replication factor Y)